MGATLQPRFFPTPVANVLANGGLWFAQRQTPGTLTTIADQKYGPDRWKSERENADVQYQRTDTSGVPETGLAARHYGTWKKITSTGKLLIYQPVENVHVMPLQSRRVTWQCKLKASASKTIRLALLQLTSSGTTDSTPAALQTAWGANTTDPTWATNVSVIGSVKSCAVTTSWQQFNVSVSMPSNAKNLFAALWTDSQFAALDTVSMSEAGLYDGAAVQPWLPKDIGRELARCQRYYHTSYPLDTAPGSTDRNCPVCFVAGNTSIICGCYPFPAAMRVRPTVTIYAPGGTSGSVEKATNAAGTGSSAVANSWGHKALFLVSDSGAPYTAAIPYSFHLTADAELT